MSKIYTGCVIVTKPYYISPFLEVHDESKTIKMFKASRNSCFEKALGATKHKLDAISHNQEAIINDVANRIK
jgi:hypothetical protein